MVTTPILTTCSAEKSMDGGVMSAVDRYQHPRIRAARQEAERRGVPLLILSGRYGLLAADAQIPWYDHALQPREVAGMVDAVAAALRGFQTIEAWMEPRSTPGWAPYHDLLEAACAAADVELRLGPVP